MRNSLLLGAALFSLGLAGLLARRNAIVMLLSAATMLQGVMLTFAGVAAWHHDLTGQVAVIVVASLSSIQTGIAIGLMIAWARPGAPPDFAADPSADTLSSRPADEVPHG